MHERFPPAAWFTTPEPDDLQETITITDEGQFSAHVAVWWTNTGPERTSIFDLHIAREDRARARGLPRNADYDRYHLTEIPTEDRSVLLAGRINSDCSHADFGSALDALTHYQTSGTAVAVVRAIEGKHGLWTAGAALPPAMTMERLARLRCSQLSGAWWAVEGRSLLVGIVVVPLT